MNALRKLGIWCVLTIPLLSGLSMVEYEINGFNYTGYIWVSQLLVALVVLTAMALIKGHLDGTESSKPWLARCGWLLLSLLWCDEIGRRNFQEAAQLTMPFVLALLASSVFRTRDDLSRLLRLFRVTFACLAIFTAIYVALTFDKEWLITPEGYNIRSTALTATLVGCVFLAGYPRRALLPIMGWGVCLLLTTVTSSRMATLSLLLAPVVHPLYRAKRWNVAGAAVVAMLSLALFYTPMFQEHFFESGEGTLTQLAQGEFIDTFRFDGWAMVWQQAWENPLFGGGAGSSCNFVPKVWAEDDQAYCHNDYLRIFFEEGLVGLTLFIGVVAWQLFDLNREINSTKGVVRTAFAAVWMGIFAMLISSSTDNTITYHIYFMNPLFALLGAAYGVAYSECECSTVFSNGKPRGTSKAAWNENVPQPIA